MEKLKGIWGCSSKKKLLCAVCDLPPPHLPLAFEVRSLRQRSEFEPGKENKERYSFIVWLFVSHYKKNQQLSIHFIFKKKIFLMFLLLTMVNKMFPCLSWRMSILTTVLPIFPLHISGAVNWVGNKLFAKLEPALMVGVADIFLLNHVYLFCVLHVCILSHEK